MRLLAPLTHMPVGVDQGRTSHDARCQGPDARPAAPRTGSWSCTSVVPRGPRIGARAPPSALLRLPHRPGGCAAGGSHLDRHFGIRPGDARRGAFRHRHHLPGPPPAPRRRDRHRRERRERRPQAAGGHPPGHRQPHRGPDLPAGHAVGGRGPALAGLVPAQGAHPRRRHREPRHRPVDVRRRAGRLRGRRRRRAVDHQHRHHRGGRARRRGGDAGHDRRGAVRRADPARRPAGPLARRRHRVQGVGRHLPELARRAGGRHPGPRPPPAPGPVRPAGHVRGLHPTEPIGLRSDLQPDRHVPHRPPRLRLHLRHRHRRGHRHPPPEPARPVPGAHRHHRQPLVPPRGGRRRPRSGAPGEHRRRALHQLEDQHRPLRRRRRQHGRARVDLPAEPGTGRAASGATCPSAGGSTRPRRC